MNRKFLYISLGVILVLLVAGAVAYAVAHSNSGSNQSSQASQSTGTTSPKTGSSPSSANPSGKTGQTSGSGSASGSGTCAASDLVITRDQSNGGGTAGSTYYTIVLTNSSHHSCTLSGYPGVSMVDDNGVQIGQSADRANTRPVQTLTLAPGDKASADVRVVDNNYPAGTCKSGATGFKVYPPNDTGYLILPVGALTWCPGFSVDTLQKA